MKRVICFFIALIIPLTFVINAFSVEIDGIDSGVEWDDAVAYKLVDGESNCGVNFGVVKAKFDNESSAIFLCFMFIDPLFEPDNQNAGVLISLEGSSFFELSMANSPYNADIDKYSFEGALTIDDNNGVLCELRIGIKEGLPRIVRGEVRFIDAIGEPSNYYSLTLVNEGYTEPTELEIAPTQDNTDPYYNPDATSKKVAINRTTDEKIYTEKRTTKKPKTTAKTTTRWALKDSPMIYTGRTKAEKTVKNDVKQSVLDAPNGVTVYYYEKEIYISHVYITEEQRETSAAMTSDLVHAATVLSNVSIEKSTDSQIKTISLSKGTKYKKLTTIIGAILFCVIAALGVYYSKKNKSKS